MLVLSRKQNERIVIGPNITITILEARDGRVRLGFDAPPSTPIHRAEIAQRIMEAEACAAATSFERELYPALSASCL